VLFDPYYVLYYAGFAFVPTERPIAFVLGPDGTRALVVPRLELEHAEARSTVDRVEHYLEYPGDPSAELVFAKTVADMRLTGTIGADQDGYPWILGYRGPALSELSGTASSASSKRSAQLAVKSAPEVALIRRRALGNLAHRLLQRYTGSEHRDGSLAAGERRGDVRVLDASGDLQRAGWSRAARCDYRGQIGRNSAVPHALAANLVFERGDVLVTGAGPGLGLPLRVGADVRGRAGRPGGMFAHMVALQDLAFGQFDRARRARRSTARCARTSSCAICGRTGTPQARHRPALSRGPFLDSGDHTEIRPGMMFTVSPASIHRSWEASATRTPSS
jgi:Xaa-Pro aminopeptidase